MSYELPASLPKHVYIVAEIGINHNGDLDIAHRLIDLAKSCGCDAVKFQKRTIETVYTSEMLAQPRESPWGTTQREQKEALEFSEAEYRDIDSYCRAIEMDWFASAWDDESQQFLRQFDLPHNKIASAMMTHPTMPSMVADEGKHTFISTGMCSYEQIDAVVEVFEAKRCPYTLLFTVSEYPCPVDHCNISGMLSLRKRYNCDVGYSGHETGIHPSIMAVSYGATALERHITLSRAMYGSDQPASLERRGLELLVNYARASSTVFGDGQRTINDQERVIAEKLRYWEA